MAEQQQQQQQQRQETDIEALQAQIDLSNSVAFDIVSSWMKPSSSAMNNIKPSVSSTVARDLEEFARRPPRLGLGATVSKSTTVTMQETARLKGKLSKKAIRGDDGALFYDDKKRRDADADEDDEESRNTVIVQRKATGTTSSKRPLDVFDTSNKKRKRSNVHSEFSHPAPTLSNKSVSGPQISTTKEISVSSSSSTPSPPSRKGKGKGKNKIVEEERTGVGESSSAAEPPYHLSDEEWTGFSELVNGHVTPEGPPSTPSSSPKSERETQQRARQAVSLSPVSRSAPDNQPVFLASYASARKVDDQIPLLNLHGPPPTLTANLDKDDMHADKKKRKRHKRKKQKLEQGLGGGGDTK